MNNLSRLLMSSALCTVCTVASAQQVNVNGIVKDAAGETVIGASVMVKGTKTGTVTDFDGNFHVECAPGSTLVISYIGYKTQEVKASDNMEVTLQEDANDLQEVVVTGYTTQKKADLTGSVAVVSTKNLKTSSETDPMRALQGRVPGMTVTTDGSPIGSGTVRIRGIGSFNSSQDPLYIIDGVPTNMALNTLNTNDIESMQVLKDAASASIYGSRASNGVIIITTKKGKKGSKVAVDFSANLTAQFYSNQSKMKLMNSSQYATAMAQAALNDGLDPVAYAANYGIDLNAASGTPITVWNPTTNQYQNYTINGRYDGYINAKKTMRFSDTDWLDEISRTGFSQNYDLSVSHANDKHSAMFSLGYKNNEGVLKYTNFENISARLNTSWNLNKIVTVGENVTLTYTSQVDCHPMENALKMPSIVPVYEEDGKTFAGPVGSMADRQNPCREQYQNRNNHLDYWRIFGNAFVELKPVKGLTLRSNFGLDFKTSFINAMTNTYHSDIVNNDIAKTTLSNNNETNWTWSNTAQYVTQIGKHNIDVLGGMEFSKQSVVDFSAYSEGYALEDKDYMWPNAATGTMRNSGAKVGYRLASFFGKVNYNWDDLLLASFTIRHDGSSRFGKNNRYATFPSFSLGWRLNREKFMQNLSWIDDLKVRGSWGQTGNQEISNIARYTIYVPNYGVTESGGQSYGTSYDIAGTNGGSILQSGFKRNQIGNDNIKWETTTQTNLGLDFSLFKQSLYGSFDWFYKKTTDILVQMAGIAAMGEGSSQWINAGEMKNVGVELNLGYRNQTRFGLKYDLNANISTYRNEITKLPTTVAANGTFGGNGVQSVIGHANGSQVGYVADGIFKSQEEIDNHATQEGAGIGRIRWRDLDGNGIINEKDQQWIYNPTPDFSYGLNIYLEYKNFDLTMFWQGVQGVDVISDLKKETDLWSGLNIGFLNKGKRVLDAWSPTNPNSTIPALSRSDTNNEKRVSTYFVENGSFLKLRNIQLGYNVPKNFAQKMKMERLRFYLSAQNVFTIKSKEFTGVDPENANYGYPIPMNITFGINVGF